MRLLNRFARRERGAVTTLVSVLLGGAVLLGSTALVVDVGQLYVEREELQSGADAAAVALAKTCATGPARCATPQLRLAVARQYAKVNARDGSASVTVACRGWVAGECPAGQPANLTACMADDDRIYGTNYVEVRTATGGDTGTTVLPRSFAQRVAGSGGEGTTVGACARAAATPGGPPLAMGAPAITFEVCFHTTYTNNGASYPTTERVLFMKDGQSDDPCDEAPSNGKNGPGNFGWLDHGGNCESQFDVADPWYGGNPGNNTEAVCQALLDRYINASTAMAIPLFDSTRGQGSNFEYHLVGFGAFMITGYKLSGKERVSRISRAHLCSGSERCLYGYWVRQQFDISRPGGPDYGISGRPTVKLVG